MFQFRKHNIIQISVSFTSKIAKDKQTPLIGINSQTANFECMYTVKHTVTSKTYCNFHTRAVGIIGDSISETVLNFI